MLAPMLRIGLAPITLRIRLITSIQSLQPMPQIAIDVGKVVVNISKNRRLIIKVTRREYLSIVLDRKIREPLVFRLPPLILSAGILRLIRAVIIGHDEIGDAL